MKLSAVIPHQGVVPTEALPEEAQAAMQAGSLGPAAVSPSDTDDQQVAGPREEVLRFEKFLKDSTNKKRKQPFTKKEKALLLYRRIQEDSHPELEAGQFIKIAA